MLAHLLADPAAVAAEVREMVAEAIAIVAINHYRRRCANTQTDPASKIEWNLRVLAEEIAYRVPFEPEMNVLDLESDPRLFAQWKTMVDGNDA